MDFLKFINSNAIRNHLKEINYEFTADEAAFVVWANDNKTIKEKHLAWEWIIHNMEDVNIHDKFERMYFEEELNIPKYYTLHNCLKKYMELENKVIEAALTTEGNTVFSFETYYHGDPSVCEDGRLFTSLDKLMKAVDEEISDMSEYQLKWILIKKSWLNTDEKKYVELKLNPDKSIFDIVDDARVRTDLESSLWKLFECMWFEIPTPFKKGDIVYENFEYCSNNGKDMPFVLEKICYWGIDDIESARQRHFWSCADMTAGGYFVEDDGRLYCIHIHNYLALDYYDEEPTGVHRILKAISNYEKNKIDLSILMDAYSIILNEERVKRHKNGMSDRILEFLG